ncbi:MAG TPA: peptidoglycan-binding protein [Devosiaceae bacterium]
MTRISILAWVISVAISVTCGVQYASAQSVNSLLNTMVQIGGALATEQARKAAPGPSTQAADNPAPTEPQATAMTPSRAQMRTVQARLNELGYDAGTPDGVAGPRTRRAISMFQRDLGEPQTGRLTAAQTERLLGDGSATASSDFEMLYDTDLPGNDFRSGMHSADLKGIALETCISACRADGMCAAFTYNANARVCFLKHGGGQPVPFRNAISGRKTASTQGPTMAGVPVAPDSMGLPSPSAAIPAPMAGMREVAPIMAGDRVVDGFPLLQGRFKSDDLELNGRPENRWRANLAFYLDLAILGAWPDILDDEAVAHEYAMRFLTGDLQDHYVRDCSWYGRCESNGPYRGWQGSNEFERKASYEAFMAEIKPRLLGMAPKLPVHLTQVAEVKLQPYDDSAQAFPIRPVRSSGTVSVPVASMDLAYSRIQFKSDIAFPQSVAVPRDGAPAFLAQVQTQERSGYVAFDLEISEPHMDENLNWPAFTVTANRIGLYADADLQSALADLSPHNDRTARAFASVPSESYVIFDPHGSMPDGANVTAERLGRALALRGNPALFDQHPSYFAALLDPAQAAPYFDERYFSGSGNATLEQFVFGVENDQWAGRDEFERSDSRKRFIAEQSQNVMARVPQGDLHIAFLQYFNVGTYKDGAFPISASWDGGGFSSVDYFDVPAPLKYPDAWVVDEEHARAYREFERRKGVRPMLRTDYVIRGTSPGGSGTIADVAVERMSIVTYADPNTMIADIPLPEGAVTTENRSLAASAPTGPLEFDPELFVLLAASRDSKLLDDPGFLTQGFALRQKIEQSALGQRDRVATSWPGFFSTTMLAADTPSAEMLASYRKAVEQRLPELGNLLVRSHVGCDTRERCVVADDGSGLKIDLRDFMAPTWQWDFASVRDTTKIDAAALRLDADPRTPEGVVRFPAGNVPVYLLLLPNSGWQVPVEAASSDDIAALDLQYEVTGVELHRDDGALLVGLRPHGVRVTFKSGGVKTYAATGEDVNPAAVNAARYAFDNDILGISLGMDRAEVRKILADRQARLADSRLFTSSADDAERIRSFIVQNAGENGAIDISSIFSNRTGDADTYDSANSVQRWINDGLLLVQYHKLQPNDDKPQITDQTAVFFDPETEKVVGISRYQALPAELDVETVRAQLKSKYGEPDHLFGYDDDMIWVDSKKVADALNSGGYEYSVCGFHFGSDTYFDFIPWRDVETGDAIPRVQGQIVIPTQMDNVFDSCGRVLYSTLKSNTLELHMYDTGWLHDRVAAIAAADKAAADAKASAATSKMEF